MACNAANVSLTGIVFVNPIPDIASIVPNKIPIIVVVFLIFIYLAEDAFYLSFYESR